MDKCVDSKLVHLPERTAAGCNGVGMGSGGGQRPNRVPSAVYYGCVFMAQVGGCTSCVGGGGI